MLTRGLGGVMAAQPFQAKDHVELYEKYRFPPPEELQNVIFSYLEEKKGKPHRLAVDVGCGSGQGTRVLAPHFEWVLGMDISEAQIQKARQAPGPNNISYRVCPAEELPLEDASVDLVTAFAAAHWFDTERFLQEVKRVLKPQGCVALSTYLPRMSLHFGDCSEQLTQIVEKQMQLLVNNYASNGIKFVLSEYKEILDAMTFPGKQRIRNLHGKMHMTVGGLIGYIQSLAMYQNFLNINPEAAKDSLKTTEESILETMGVHSNETQIEVWMNYVCILGYKMS
uniref:Methyltransferase type 11 domain-containing protein n=2 Tax=Ornithorhynchus anatinus TaxID=9258 RepID=F7EXM1_ORNAN